MRTLKKQLMSKQYTKAEYKDSELTSKIIGACIEVHKNLGSGFSEITYQRALALEFKSLGLDFAREVKVPVYYKGKQIGARRVDFLIDNCMLEIKAKSEFNPEDYVQALSYLKASGFELGLLINFGSKKIEIKRLINTKEKK